MRLDPDTLLIVNAANLLMLASTLPVLMGRQLSPAARDARRSLILHGVGWIAIIASGFWPNEWPDHLLSSLTMACFSAGQWLMFQALKGWLGPRPLERALWVIVLLTPLGYAISFPSYPLRVGWSNFLIATQLLILARATLWPTTTLRGPWRWALLTCLLAMAGLTATRGILGAFFTELYPSFRTPHPVNLAAMLAANITLVIGNVAVLVAWREEAEQQLRTQAITDRLTGVLNRHGWNERATHLVAQARRHGLPLSLLTLDLDHFKRINDTRGHEAGDTALQLFGRLLAGSQRSGDLVARLGGEEFCVLLPLADEAAARGFDQRLRAMLAATAPVELDYPLDFSAGLAVLEPDGETLETLMTRADTALYRAKREGRGRLAAATGSHGDAAEGFAG